MVYCPPRETSNVLTVKIALQTEDYYTTYVTSNNLHSRAVRRPGFDEDYLCLGPGYNEYILPFFNDYLARLRTQLTNDKAHLGALESEGLAMPAMSPDILDDGGPQLHTNTQNIEERCLNMELIMLEGYFAKPGLIGPKTFHKSSLMLEKSLEKTLRQPEVRYVTARGD